MKRIFSCVLLLAVLASCLCTSVFAAEDPLCVDFQLAATPSTGFVWTITASDENIVTITDTGFTPESDAADASGMNSYCVSGVSAGSTDLIFSYARPEESSDPFVSFTFSATVQENLDVALAPHLTFPVDAASDCRWVFAQEHSEVLAVQPGDSENQFKMSGTADGTDTVTFGYLSASGAKLFFAYIFKVETAADSAGIRSFTFLHNDTDPCSTDIPFSTTDLDGNPVTDEIFSGHTLTILNFWEPWCGPCVSEMPALQRISQEYADRGVQVVGVYSTPDSEDEVLEVLESAGVTYPILNYTNEFDFLQTGYVPTTVFIDGSGKIIKPPFSVAMSYGAWVEMIEELL